MLSHMFRRDRDGLSSEATTAVNSPSYQRTIPSPLALDIKDAVGYTGPKRTFSLVRGDGQKNVLRLVDKPLHNLEQARRGTTVAADMNDSFADCMVDFVQMDSTPLAAAYSVYPPPSQLEISYAPNILDPSMTSALPIREPLENTMKEEQWKPLEVGTPQFLKSVVPSWAPGDLPQQEDNHPNLKAIIKAFIKRSGKGFVIRLLRPSKKGVDELSLPITSPVVELSRKNSDGLSNGYFYEAAHIYMSAELDSVGTELPGPSIPFLQAYELETTSSTGRSRTGAGLDWGLDKPQYPITIPLYSYGCPTVPLAHPLSQKTSRAVGVIEDCERSDTSRDKSFLEDQTVRQRQGGKQKRIDRPKLIPGHGQTSEETFDVHEARLLSYERYVGEETGANCPSDDTQESIQSTQENPHGLKSPPIPSTSAELTREFSFADSERSSMLGPPGDEALKVATRKRQKFKNPLAQRKRTAKPQAPMNQSIESRSETHASNSQEISIPTVPELSLASIPNINEPLDWVEDVPGDTTAEFKDDHQALSAAQNEHMSNNKAAQSCTVSQAQDTSAIGTALHELNPSLNDCVIDILASLSSEDMLHHPSVRASLHVIPKPHISAPRPLPSPKDAGRRVEDASVHNTTIKHASIENTSIKNACTGPLENSSLQAERKFFLGSSCHSTTQSHDQEAQLDVGSTLSLPELSQLETEKWISEENICQQQQHQSTQGQSERSLGIVTEPVGILPEFDHRWEKEVAPEYLENQDSTEAIGRKSHEAMTQISQNQLAAFMAIAVSALLRNTLSMLRPFLESHQRTSVIPKDHVRVRWTCKCGKQMFDDFIERRPGAAQLLEEHLNRPQTHPGGSTSGSSSSSHRTNSSQTSLNTQGTSATSLDSRDITSARTPDMPYSSRFSSGLTTRGNSNIVNINGYQEQLWLLACSERQKFTTKLVHFDADPQKIRSDMKLAVLVKRQYAGIRPKWKQALRLRGLCTIQFVQFELHRSQAVDIRKCPDIPDKTDDNYVFTPSDLIPPVGEHYLMHLLHHPEDHEDEQITYKRIPKKRGFKLRVSDQEDVAIGWGIHLVEGFLPYKVWALFTNIFAVVSVVFGVTWAVKRGDVQGAFGVAAYICAFATLIIGCCVAYFE